MSYLPLSDKGRMSQSIAGFVVQHPEFTDIIAAYNAWVTEVQWRSFPWDETDIVPFCLNIFDVCMNKLTRKTLEDIYYSEEMLLSRCMNEDTVVY